MAIDLKAIQRGRQARPPRIVIYSEHGMGKSTFASQAPSPIFIPTEDGLGALDVAAFPLATTYQAVMDAIGVLYTDDHDYKTVVLDSLDWLEALVWGHVAREGGEETIEGFGYGKGYVYACDRFRDVLAGLNALRTDKGMAVILTAHSMVKRFDDPASEPYDRYMLKLHSKAAGIVQEWADVVGFIAQQMVVRKEDVGFNKKVARGVAIGGHVLHLKRTPAFDGKNRYSLPDAIPLGWGAFADAMTEAHAPSTDK